MQRPKVQTAYKVKQMPTITTIYKELLKDDISPALKELCYKFFQENSLSWEGSRRDGEWVLRDCSKSILADIIKEDFDLDVFSVNCSHKLFGHILFDYEKFNSFSEAIRFVSFEFMKAGFIVLPPDFEV